VLADLDEDPAGVDEIHGAHCYAETAWKVATGSLTAWSGENAAEPCTRKHQAGAYARSPAPCPPLSSGLAGCGSGGASTTRLGDERHAPRLARRADTRRRLADESARRQRPRGLRAAGVAVPRDSSASTRSTPAPASSVAYQADSASPSARPSRRSPPPCCSSATRTQQLSQVITTASQTRRLLAGHLAARRHRHDAHLVMAAALDISDNTALNLMLNQIGGPAALQARCAGSATDDERGPHRADGQLRDARRHARHQHRRAPSRPTCAPSSSATR
jgi:hypothetical protein